MINRWFYMINGSFYLINEVIYVINEAIIMMIKIVLLMYGTFIVMMTNVSMMNKLNMSMLTSPLIFLHFLLLNKESFGVSSMVQIYYQICRIGTELGTFSSF